uniref:Uncharacterized protein n=2 Tax=Rhodnius prolixus TaxID=13249 RepID=A0A905R0Q9_RHOPR
MSDSATQMNGDIKYSKLVGEEEEKYPYWMGYEFGEEGVDGEELARSLKKSESTLRSTTIHNYSISPDTSYLTLPEQSIEFDQVKITPTEQIPPEHKPIKEGKKTKIYRKPLKGKMEVEGIRYFKQHKIMDFLSFLMKHVLVKQPDNVTIFLIELLDECIMFRGGISNAPTLFQDRHLISMYHAFDPLNVGYISSKQYKVAMTTLGVTEYPPLGEQQKCKKDCNNIFKPSERRIRKDDFLRIAKMSLNEQLLDMLVVPAPSEEMTDYSPYSLRETDGTVTPEPTPTPTPTLKLKIQLASESEEKIIGEDDEYMMDEYVFGEDEYPREKKISTLAAVWEEQLVKEAPKEKPEIYNLQEHPQLKVKIYHEKPMVTEFIDMVEPAPKLPLKEAELPPMYFTHLDEGYRLEEHSERLISKEPLPPSEMLVKPKKEGKPLISSHSKGWTKPDRHFMKTLDKLKSEARKKLEQAKIDADLLKQKQDVSQKQKLLKEDLSEFSGHLGVTSQFFLPESGELEE